MDQMEIKKVGVLGFGLMGSGIVETAARAGFDVVVREISEEFLEGGFNRIRKNLGRAVKKNRMDQAQMDAILGRIQGTTEAVVEFPYSKKRLGGFFMPGFRGGDPGSPIIEPGIRSCFLFSFWDRI